jgi:uncharacterized protein YheU (UPF0270 family)
MLSARALNNVHTNVILVEGRDKGMRECPTLRKFQYSRQNVNEMTDFSRAL